MVLVSVLHDALKTMYNAEKRGKRQVLIRPSSKVVIKFLQVMMRHGEPCLLVQCRRNRERWFPVGLTGTQAPLLKATLSALLLMLPPLRICTCSEGYIGEFEYVDDHRAGKIVVELNGRYAPELSVEASCEGQSVSSDIYLAT